MKGEAKFQEEFGKLNAAQKQAVEALEGPVMVIAGPGTGKTQVLTLRIANILRETDTPADGILCLTFTNSGVRAMRDRLTKLIGEGASRITVATFHSFASALVEEFYEHLALPSPPTLLDDRDAILLAHDLLENEEWEYLRPRSGRGQNFKDLRSLISLLKREGLTPKMFMDEVRMDIDRVKNDKANLSSRGPSKGELKKEVKERISRLERSLEAGSFYEMYEAKKKLNNQVDYDDLLHLALELVCNSAEARATLAERYLYILVDEHQDSSGVQNEFLRAVWGEVEKPNLFVVGDDRQLIYGFGGASLSHFESFQASFLGTQLITLTENYRSSQSILDTAEELLQSIFTQGKLRSQSGKGELVRLVEAEFERDEILAAGLHFKELLAHGAHASNLAILVPKNYQVRSATKILEDLGLPVARGGKTSLLNIPEARALKSILGFIAHPNENPLLASLLLETSLDLPRLETQKFLHKVGRHLDLEKLMAEKGALGEFGKKLESFIESVNSGDVYDLIQLVSQKIFFTPEKEKSHERFLVTVEMVRTFLHLALSRIEREPHFSLRSFVDFLDRLEEYGEEVPVSVFRAEQGVRVSTLHASKGLEFQAVWVAHLDERSLLSGRARGFTLPQRLEAYAEKKDELTSRRELYVAITRAREECTLSYAKVSYTGGSLTLAHIVSELPIDILEKVTAEETEKKILKEDSLAYITSVSPENPPSSLSAIQELVKENFASIPATVTQINNFFQCPWRWYFRNFLRLPEPESEFLVFGNFAHALAEEVLEIRSARMEDLEEKMGSTLDTFRVFDEGRRRRFKREVEPVLVNFGQKILPHISAEAVAEKPLKVQDEASGLSLTGKIDLLENLEDGYRVSDFKTGRSRKASEIEKRSGEGRLSDYLRQLTMYSYLLENQRVKRKVTSSRLIFLEALDSGDFIYETEISDVEKRLLVQDLKDFHQALSTGRWTDRSCSFKPSQFERECPYCALKDNLLK
jgi:DNA helicase II / ATP-dependent DNA helicase PcrA